MQEGVAGRDPGELGVRCACPASRGRTQARRLCRGWAAATGQLSSKPAAHSMAYRSLLRSSASSWNSGSFSRFMQVLAVGSRSRSEPPLWMQNAGYSSCKTVGARRGHQAWPAGSLSDSGRK